MKIYQDPHADVEARVEDLLGRMTLEEMIMQTDQYFSHDFTRWDADGDAVCVDMEELARLLHRHSAGSIQPRGMTVEQINQVQRWAVEKTRLGIPDYPHDEWQAGLRRLAERGRLPAEVIRRACARVLRVKFLPGLFDRPYTDEAAQEKVHCPEHRALAREIARESIVLLKNEDGLLPLRRDLGAIAVLGPSAGQAALGDYTPGGKTGVSVLDGIRSLVSSDTRVLYDPGCSFLGETAEPFPPEVLTDEEGTQGLTGRYYNGPELAGEPVMIRSDPRIDFNWIYAKPHPELDAGRFSVVWTGFLTMPESFQGGIGFSSQDSMRLYVDGELLLDGWGSSGMPTGWWISPSMRADAMPCGLSLPMTSGLPE